MNKYKESAFTLVELLVVITIVGILTSIAIPQFRSYKRLGYDLQAQVDLRNIATAEEAFFLANEEYLSCTDSTCKTLPGVVSITNGVKIEVAAETDSFEGRAFHENGSGKIFVWRSLDGGFTS